MLHASERSVEHKSIWSCLGVPALLVLLLTQAPAPDSIDDDRKNIPEPKERLVSPVNDYLTSAIIKPAGQKLDVRRNVLNIFRSQKEAENVSELDEIRDSSWFTNRNFWNPLSTDKFNQGPALSDHAPDAGPWTVTKCKTDGVMPGFRIRDQKGESFILKFDPPGYLEMSTAADVIASKFLYAAGYNVPENFIAVFDEQILVPEHNLACSGSNGEKLILSTPGSLSQFLEKVPRTPQGQLRAMASKLIQGKIKGPFSYVGVRKDDPNDRIPHEHRRELRGLRMIQAFLNNGDVKQLNTLDAYVEEDGRKFLKHYLIDFGDSLGSASTRPKNAGDGHHYLFDPAEIIKTTFTLGLNRRQSASNQIQCPSIGYIEGATFDPMDWRSNSPNPAFENMTKRDGYWAAKIVASFTNEQIEAAVRAGQYSDPKAERTLAQIMKQRRDRIADYWFRRVAPLDRFRFTSAGLTFDDLAIEGNLDNAANVKYEVLIEGMNATTVSQGGFETAIPIMVTASPSKVQIRRLSRNWRELQIDVIVRLVNGNPAVVGIQR
jgi:hypothetical protein